ncbi:nuclear transport factor 2 family protein [Ponticaulis sp.]|uniref:nuclear transport factor 2 family protein n=1 Tax=Ponticaulis sp. TaxID=2020902 RepID=UPI000C5F6AAA|nr:nuclear transport factor 2 family protein [Ponticaulis sp.]MAJ10050.1 hypothetical protein [Ponticaulis sp.]HBH89904.1 hypothetical protein [Hyphomonadaceae bacterium]HBJ91860.1 hypothetical protein [Hyphomonadaceae bacterium]
MNHTIKTGISGAFIVFVAACTQNEASPEQAVIELYTAAYNEADVASMAALMSDTVQWFAIEGGVTVPMADGKEDLSAQLTTYLASTNTTSTLSDWTQNGAFLSVIETASWSSQSGESMSQSSLAVYEIRNDRIQRVWYYPTD